MDTKIYLDDDEFAFMKANKPGFVRSLVRKALTEFEEEVASLPAEPSCEETL
jgi:hypothetical protein